MDKTMQQATIYVGLNDRITGVLPLFSLKKIWNEYSKNICYKPCQAGRDISLAGLFYFAFTLC